MKCDICKEKEATIHIQEVVNNNIKSIHLCEECAKAYGIKSNLMDLGFTLIDLFTNIATGKIKSQPAPSHTHLPEKSSEPYIHDKFPLKCPVCGETFIEFIETAKFGCGLCYVAFKEKIKPLLRKIHSKAIHKGKIPKKMEPVVKLNQNLKELDNKLKIALKKENYEEAAKIRDQIKKIKLELGEKL